MDIHKGYVSIGVVRQSFDAYHLFGPRIHETAGPYENIRSNGLLFFPSTSDARAVSKEIAAIPGIDFTRCAKLQLGIYDKNEIEEMQFRKDDRRKRSLVVILYEYDYQCTLIGRMVEGRPACGARPGAYINDNGCNPIATLSSALYIMSEHIRQAASPATLAEFNFKILKYELE